MEIVPDIAQSTHGIRNIFADIRNVPTRPHMVFGMFLLPFPVIFFLMKNNRHFFPTTVIGIFLSVKGKESALVKINKDRCSLKINTLRCKLIYTIVKVVIIVNAVSA